MRAAICPAYGPPEVVEVGQLPAPRLEDDQVRVRVGAAAVNFPDVLLIADRYQISVPPPFVPGSEFSGTVIEIGCRAAGFALGDRVTGIGLHGAFAEEVVQPVTGLTLVPAGIDDRSAAAFGVAYRTAYHALRSVVRVRAGDDIVVLGAGGGVGLATVALGSLLGAAVTAVASSTEKLDMACRNGAQQVINHRDGDLRQALKLALPDGAHAVIDPVGGALAEPALRSLRRGGKFVTVGFASGDIPAIPLNLVLVKGVQVLGFHMADIAPDEFSRNEGELRELLASGRVRPHIGAVYPLEQTAAALTHVAEGRAIGKVVIDLRR
ncbi:NADPH:quinone oxidoreductase family protein [Mycobacterium sp. SMC-4]|uniref:NADPH:quinone oxidoreductase family protein n=1 Tax=Mycobacterium sp. SMC-4 TaxID=2857059 RepID=UPI0021B288C9|nr:NADPH:quinone oxidoreductase family protein [Mycobacterium sp. SMC-4]UXA16618.1 NADPH:quinone oxidoreductase family protein [Mycobacterium sp. SMC-4]